MNSRTRLVNAILRKPVDRLPVTTHHIMPYYLNRYMGGISERAFFEQTGLDPIRWIMPLRRMNPGEEYVENGLTQSDDWRISTEELSGYDYHTVRYTIHTPGGDLSMIKQANVYTSWVVEHLVKEKTDIELIAKYAPVDLCDVEEVNRIEAQTGDSALIRGTIPSFHLFGQPGCWQDVACLYGIEKLIFETFDDPKWVHEFLEIMLKRKLEYVASMKGARYDINELGGGDASSTVISPAMFDTFVAPYDSQIIQAAKEVDQRIVYHTCGGMMPILENIVSMKPAAIETLTPLDMGGDVDLAEAKRRIGDQVCMIGGFDQGHYFTGCTEAETRTAVRKCFEEAGAGGGFILSPSDHFFDADPKLVMAFADEARKCRY